VPIAGPMGAAMIDDRTAPYAALVLRLSLSFLFFAHLYRKFAFIGFDNWWSGLSKQGYPDWTLAYTLGAEFAGAVLLLLGLVHRQDYFPFGLFQAAAIAAAAWFGLRALLARPTARRWMVAYVALFFALAFFARYFNDSHFGVLAAMALCCRPLGGHLLPGNASLAPLQEAA